MNKFCRSCLYWISWPPSDKKGQRHDKGARCREKLIGEDNCVQDRPCSISDNFSKVQRESLATPTYKIRKEKKSGLLVSPKEVTVVAPVNENEPTFQSLAGPSVQPADHSTPQGPSTSSFVTSEQLLVMSDYSDKWAQQFVRMEALLSSNLFEEEEQEQDTITVLLDPLKIRTIQKRG